MNSVRPLYNSFQCSIFTNISPDEGGENVNPTTALITDKYSRIRGLRTVCKIINRGERVSLRRLIFLALSSSGRTDDSQSYNRSSILRRATNLV